MENKDNTKSSIMNIEINQKKCKKPLEDIIKNNFSVFKMEDVIHIFFSIQGKENNFIPNIQSNYLEGFCHINKNTLLQLRIFLEVLRENYDDESIIKEFYKYLFYEKKKDKEFQSKKTNKKENLSKDEIKSSENDELIIKNDEIDYPLIKKKRKNKTPEHNFIKIKKNWIIPLKSNYSKMKLKEEDTSKNIVSYLHKGNFNQLYIYYPIEKENILYNDDMNNIIKDKNKILFTCELYAKENENDRCNSYGIFDLATKVFSLGGLHSKDCNVHPLSQKLKKNNNLPPKNELMEIILRFSKMKMKGALIVK